MKRIIEKIIKKIGRSTFRQLLRFSLIGILNALVHYSVYLLFLYYLNFYYLWALIFSHIIAVFHSYFWNRFWAFESKDRYLKEIPKFFTVYTLSFLLNLILLPLLVEIFKLKPGFAQLIPLILITLINFIFNFLGLKFWTFRYLKSHD